MIAAAIVVPFLPATSASACGQPDTWAIAAAFDRAANGQLPSSYPQIPTSTGVRTIPPSVLKAVGWVESNWRQFTPSGRPLLSFDFGYGIMQVTSGMAGAFGSATGSIDAPTQSLIASDYTYNIAYGARMLAQKWASTPKIAGGDPSAVEDWYYALWAYNGWGWVNNPNNPRFTRLGTPATNPSTYPYQERVLYLVAHPPTDSAGNPLWQPVRVTLPSESAIGTSPKAIVSLKKVHRQPAPSMDAVYRPASLSPMEPGGQERVAVKVTNTGTAAWSASGGISLTYHVLSATANPWKALSPFSAGVIAFGQGSTPFSGPVLPGRSRTVTMTVTAPTAPGHYQIVWDLESSLSWASAAGVLPRVEKLSVLRTGQMLPSPTPSPKARPDPPFDLLFVADTSIPDGTTVQAGTRFTKSWLVFNSGAQPWTSNLYLKLISGKAFGHKRISLPATAPCRAANVLTALKAPKSGGQYKSVWQLVGAGGKRAGDTLTLVVTVKGRPSSHPTPTPTVPTLSPTPSKPTATATPAG